MKNQPRAEQVTLARLQALSEPIRWRIIILLMAWGEQTVSSLVARLDGVPQPKVSHHLAVLRQVGLVEAGREGRTRPYRLSKVWQTREDAIVLVCGGGKVELTISPQPWVET